MLVGGGTLRGFNAALDKLRSAQAANLQFQPVGVHFRKHEQVFGEPRKAPRMLENDLQETEAVLRVVDGAREKRFRETLNSGERRSKFVRNVGNEIAANALELAQVGDVVQHEYGAGRFSSAHGRGGGGK